MKLTRIGGLPAAPDGQDGNQPHSASTGETGLECYGDVLGLYRIWGGHLLHSWGCFGAGSVTSPRPSRFPAGNLDHWFWESLNPGPAGLVPPS